MGEVWHLAGLQNQATRVRFLPPVPIFKGLGMSRTVKKSYTGSKRFDKTCRSHGGCPHCESNRLRYKKIAKDLYNAGVVQLAET